MKMRIVVGALAAMLLIQLPSAFAKTGDIVAGYFNPDSKQIVILLAGPKQNEAFLLGDSLTALTPDSSIVDDSSGTMLRILNDKSKFLNAFSAGSAVFANERTLPISRQFADWDAAVHAILGADGHALLSQMITGAAANPAMPTTVADAMDIDRTVGMAGKFCWKPGKQPTTGTAPVASEGAGNGGGDKHPSPIASEGAGNGGGDKLPAPIIRSTAATVPAAARVVAPPVPAWSR